MMIVRKKAAFTMIEIMVVLFIIGMMATLGGPRILRFMSMGKETGTTAYLNELKSALALYEMHIGHYPTKQEGELRALVDRPSIQAVAAKWDGPYIDEEKLNDKWGNEIVYNCPPQKHKDIYRYFEVISYGENGEDGGGKELHSGG